MTSSRFIASAGAVGTFLVVLFVHSFGDARPNSDNFFLFAANVAQNDDSNVDKDFAQKSENRDFADDKKSNGADASNDSAWFRIDRDAHGVPIGLSTSIVRYEGRFEGNDGAVRDVSVDLIGAIHIAEKNYFNELNDSFQKYETVVFEMILPRGADPRVALAEERNKKAKITGSPLNAISFFQQTLGESLGLVYQINGIDYSRENLRRGDADAEDFLLQILTNGDIPNFFVDAFLESLTSQTGGQTEGWALACALAKDRQTALRRLVATQLMETELAPNKESIAEIPESATENNVAQLEEAERENALIHYRNKIAIEVARQELAAGRTKIAIFYGAAHLSDLGRRLESDLNLERNPEPRWISAWKMESAASSKTEQK